MEKKKILNQMIDLHRAAFDNCFSTIITLKDQEDKLVKTFVDHVPGMSDEGKKVIGQCTDSYNKGLDDLKQSLDEGYAKVEAFFNSNAMLMFQDHIEKMFNAFSNQRNLMPQDLNKIMEKLTANYKNGSDKFKKYVDENIWCLKYFLPVAIKTQIKPQTQTKPQPQIKPKTQKKPQLQTKQQTQTQTKPKTKAKKKK
jgi:hypothetical protein